MHNVTAKVDSLVGVHCRTHRVQSMLIFSTLAATLCETRLMEMIKKMYGEAWIFYVGSVQSHDTVQLLSYKEHRMFHMLRMKYSLKYNIRKCSSKLLKLLCLSTSVSKSRKIWVGRTSLSSPQLGLQPAFGPRRGSKLWRELPEVKDIWTLVSVLFQWFKNWASCVKIFPPMNWLCPFVPPFHQENKSTQTCSFVRQNTVKWVKRWLFRLQLHQIWLP